MITARFPGCATMAACAVVVFVGLQSTPASAQLFWDWGGGNEVGASGREIVRFSPQYDRGQLIVSFGDRRLLCHEAWRSSQLSHRCTA
jgi:hypothetical protein